MKFSELLIGQTFKTKSYELTKKEIVEFASNYDPQYMHIDEKRAEESIFKGIIASGLHTLSISWKLWIELDFLGDDVIGGVGMNNARFHQPVYPGDCLSVEVEIVDKKLSKPDRGMITMSLNTYNQNNKRVMNVEVNGLFKV